MAVTASVASRNTRLDAITALLNSGKLRIYSGTRPATPDAAITGTLLTELTFGATAFGAAAAGAATANAITQDSAADNTGTATHFRCFQSNGTTAVIDGDVGVSGSDLNLATVSIVQNAQVSITALTITQN